MNHEDNKKTHIIIAISVLIIITIITSIYMMFFNKKEDVDLTTVSNKLFAEHMDKLLNVPEKKNIQSSYTVTDITIIAGNSKEFISEINYDLMASIGNDTELAHCKWSMRIKKDSNKKYSVIDEGANLSTKGLKLVKASTKTISKKSTDLPLSLDTDYKYSISNNKLSVTYDKGANWTLVPVTLDNILKKEELTNLANGKNGSLEDGSYYITPEITAFIHGGENMAVKVTITKDKGKSWSTFDVQGTESQYGYERKFVGFTSPQQGFAVLTSSVAMGHQENNIYETKDGGKTWSEIGNTNNTYARVVTGAGFASDKIILIGFRYENDNNPTIYRTTDSGGTWKKVYIELPSKYKNDYATPLCPVFKGSLGVLPVKLRDANKIIQFTTNNYGETWKFDKDVVYSNQMK